MWCCCLIRATVGATLNICSTSSPAAALKASDVQLRYINAFGNFTSSNSTSGSGSSAPPCLFDDSCSPSPAPLRSPPPPSNSSTDGDATSTGGSSSSTTTIIAICCGVAAVLIAIVGEFVGQPAWCHAAMVCLLRQMHASIACMHGHRAVCTPVPHPRWRSPLLACWHSTNPGGRRRWLPAVFVCVLHKRKMRKARADAEFMVHRWSKEREMGEWQHRVLPAPFGGSLTEEGIRAASFSTFCTGWTPLECELLACCSENAHTLPRAPARTPLPVAAAAHRAKLQAANGRDRFDRARSMQAARTGGGQLDQANLRRFHTTKSSTWRSMLGLGGTQPESEFNDFKGGG